MKSFSNKSLKRIAKAIQAVKVKEDEWLDSSNILAPHEVRDEDKLSALIESMGRDGWIGRPILVFEDPDSTNGYIHALTGTHRLNAAQALGFEVPVISIERECRNQGLDDVFLEELWDEIEESMDDEGLKNLFMSRLPGFEVTEVMLEEKESS
jgi:uncharacterized ParB-like nuclease family protein